MPLNLCIGTGCKVIYIQVKEELARFFQFNK